MIRPKLLIPLVVSLIFLSSAFSVNTYGETGNALSTSSSTGLSPGGDFLDGGNSSTATQAQDSPNSAKPPKDKCPNCPPDSEPFFVNFSEIDSLYLCEGEIIYDTFIVNDSNTDQTVTIEILSGPGTLTSTPGLPPVYGYYEYMPEGEDSFEITLLAYDSNNDSTIVTKTYYIFVNQLPTIISGDTTLYNCISGNYFYYDVKAYDPDDGNNVTFRLLSGSGTINSNTGIIKFYAGEPEEYCHLVEVSDECGSDTAEICITVEFNSIPVMNNDDQVFYTCIPDTICFDIFASDPDGESVVITQIDGPGIFNMVDDTSGQTCFLPADVDSADYRFIYEVADSCLSLKCSEGEICPPKPRDTVIITVVKGQSVYLDCPNDTSLFICEPDTLCFPIGELPGDAIVFVEPPSAWYDTSQGTVCFYTNCTVNKDLKVVVESVCGIDSCMFNVDVTMNTAPLVILGPDTSMFMCVTDQLCLPVGISDADNNIMSVDVQPQGYYDAATGMICTDYWEDGLNKVVVTVTDSCGVIDIDSVNVNITMNSAPVVTAPIDTSVYLCDLQEICYPVEMSDIDNNIENITISPFGYYDPASGMVCFTPDESGVYSFTVTVIDSCGSEGTAVTNITVGIDGPPEVIAAGDSTVFLCEPSEICFPVSVTDPEDKIYEIRVIGGGAYLNGFVCFAPTDPGSYTFIIEAEDDCGNVDSDTTVIDVIFNTPPVVTTPNDTAISLCDYEEICLDVGVVDLDSNVVSISANLGYYNADTKQVCFTPDASGSYEITVTATDECMASHSSTIIVAVYMGQTALIDCPEGPIYKSLCAGELICYDLTIMPRWAEVNVSFGTYENGQLCFMADTAGVYNITVTADAECGSDTCKLVFDIDMEMIPEITCPADTAIDLCGPEMICLPIEIRPDYAEITVTPTGYFEAGSLCFNADSSGHYKFEIIAETDCGRDTCNFAVDVAFNGTPEIVTSDTAMFICEPGLIEYAIMANDPENDAITYSLISGGGEINAETGLLTVNAAESGRYCFTVEASDICGADTAEICVDITINSAPVVISADDYEVFLCEPSPVCFEVSITDVDGNILEKRVNKGAYSNDYICFTPEESGTYEFITTATDSCGATDEDTTVVEVVINSAPVVNSAPDFDTLVCDYGEICMDVNIFDTDENIQSISTNLGRYDSETKQVCFAPDAEGIYYIITTVIDSCLTSDEDTTVVNVTIDEFPSIACPFDPANVVLCGPQEFCFPIDISPANAMVTASFGTYRNGQLCFMADTSGMYVIEVIAETACGVDTCNFSFDVVINEIPQLTCPADTAIELCNPDLICLPFMPIPYDATVAVLPIGYYVDGMICFNADTSGHYEISLSLFNECGEDTCSFAVDVMIYGPPEIVTGDTSMFVCEPGVLTYQITADAADNGQIEYSLIGGGGEINAATGLLSFNADTSGIYCFTVEAVGVCGADTADICINVKINSVPVVVSADDYSVSLCAPTPQCFPVDYSDIDDNIVDMNISYGAYSHGYVCFTPEASGSYEFIITVTDACGAVAADTTVIDVIMNTAPMVISAPDIDTFMCDLAEICIDVDISDSEENIESIISGPGEYNPGTGRVCFMPDAEGTYYIVTTATDSCGLYDSDTTMINITLGESAEIICPIEPIDIFLCEPQEYCFPLDINAESVLTSYGTYVNGQLCFFVDTAGTYIIEVIADAECGSDTCQITFNVTMGDVADVICPNDTSMTICGPETICLPVTVTPANAVVTVSPSGNYVDGNICFDAEQSGTYEIMVKAESECGVDSCSFTVDVAFNQSPEIVSGDTTFFDCYLAEMYIYQVVATDYESDKITYKLLSGFGNIDPAGGLITFSPDSAGKYCFEVEASDYCGADTAEICFTIDLNSPPVVVSGPDTTVLTCDWSDICIPVEVSDVDDNIETITSNIGTYANGEVCFGIYEEGTFEVITTAMDVCGATDSDTTLVTVILGESPALECPVDTSIFICAPDTLCIPIGGVPEGARLTISPPSVWYDSDKQSLCFYTNCSIEKDIKIVAETDCAIDSCMFLVDVTMNSEPLVIMRPDTAVSLCGPEEICISVGITDADDNIVDVEVSPGAVYDAFTGNVCFTPNTSGDNVIKVRAVDACGAYDLDSTVVTVNFNSGPSVDAPESYDAFNCEISEVCFPAEIYDTDNNIANVTVLPSGTYDPASGNVCFTPNDVGIYQIIVAAIDSCGFMDADTTLVNVAGNRPPTVAAADTSVFSCGRVTLCIPVSIDDPDGNLDVVYAQGAGYYQGYACFSTSVSGIREIIITAVDSCGAYSADTIYADITINSAPVVVSGPDTSVFQCDFAEICVDVDISDADDNIDIIETNYGMYDAASGKVCFTPTEAGSYEVRITATDDCGQIGESTTLVTVETTVAAQIDCPIEPIDLYLCRPELVCYELGISPEEAVVTASYGYYENGNLCFQADTAGTYIIDVSAETVCGGDQCTLAFNVEVGVEARIECPADTLVFLCDVAEICLPVGVTPDYAQVAVSPIGTYADGSVCFTADTAGQYAITIIAVTDCGADTCTVSVDVDFNDAPVVDAGNDTTYFQCDFVEICRPVSVFDPDNTIDSVVVTPYGLYSELTGSVCFTPPDVGEYCMTVTAYDECGATDSDVFCITVTTGPRAKIECPTEPFFERLCDPGEICVPMMITPATAEISVSFGTYADGNLCFFADTAGLYNITVIASEICADDTCVVPINVAFDEYVSIGCPSLPTSATLCTPDTVSILLPISPSSASINIKPAGIYDFQSQTLKFFADTSGHYEVTIIAGSPCSVDTCVVEADVNIYHIPEITCPGDIDTLVCLSEFSEICFPVQVVGAEVEVTVMPEGNYSGGMVCIPIREAGLHTTTIIASSLCGADTCIMDINIIANEAPVLAVPEDLIIPWCDDETDPLCIDGIFAEDNEGDTLTITQLCGPGEFTLAGEDSGAVCFNPPNIDSTYEFCFEVTDGCSVDSQAFLVTVFPSPSCSVCVDVSIETDSSYVVGYTAPVRIMIETNEQIGGFDLLIGYDISALTFGYALQGDDISGWEYFTYRIIDNNNCGAGCPSGLLRLVGIADENDGAGHPPVEELQPSGILARLGMKITNDQNLGGQFLPLSFYWIDCGDNSFADPDGTELFIDARIYSSEDELIWDEFDDANYPEASRPLGLGAVDSCLEGDKTTPERCVYFHNGGIRAKRPEDIDDRGDVNLNGVPYEISDAVVFTNYFIYGISAFQTNVDGQTAATDINADGFTLTVADLVYLVRVIVGDAEAIPKFSPNMLNVDLTASVKNNNLSVTAGSDCAVGAALLVFEYDGIRPQMPVLGEMARGMDMAYNITDREIRVLIYSYEHGRAIDAGEGELLNIDYTGNGHISLVETSLASYHGDVIRTNLTTSLLPEEFSVSQNYPNPFNPVTSVDLSIPAACKWEMHIYNINGQCVRQFGGEANPGVMTVTWDGLSDDGQMVASGIYFYKVQAGEFTAKKKMTLLK